MKATICYEVDGGGTQTMTRSMGTLPIMVMSNRCRLKDNTGPQLAGLSSDEEGRFWDVFRSRKMPAPTGWLATTRN